MIEEKQKAAIISETEMLWNTERQPAGCPHCRRVFLVPSDQTGARCPLCRQATLEPQPVRMRAAEPERMLPFRVGKDKLHAIYENFISGVWIKPEDFTTDHLLQRAIPVFWPLWLVDCDISGQWQMEAGFDYQVQSAKETFSGGEWHSRKQIEDRVRWEPRLGELTTHVDNVNVPALEEHRNREEITGSYPLQSAQAFLPDQLGNAVMEVPDLPPEDAWPLARPHVDKTAASICTKAAGAQHHRNFVIKANYQNQNWTQFLLPLYTTYYRDDEGQPQIVIVNGQTGKIKGPRLASPERGRKIAGIIAGAAGLLFFLALLSLLLTLVFPPAGIIAALLGILGFGTGIAAIIPAVWPSQWNRKQKGPRIVTRR